jgi:hypothetical protein
MRWPHDSAVTRRNEQLARTRRLTAWIAGGATTASFALAAALGIALPGHTSSSGAHSAGQAGTNPGSARGSGTSTATGHHRGRHHRLSRPQQAPSRTSAPPVVSSGGS